MASRWELLLEQKPIPLVDHLLEEVAKLIAKDLEAWPPPLVELDPTLGKGAQALLEAGRPKPSAIVYEESFRLARWEISREFEAYDDYMRNARYEARGLPPETRAELLFLSRWLVEQLLGLGEATEGRVNRRMMGDLLVRIERRLGGRAISPPI
jgi:hypothetical protein